MSITGWKDKGIVEYTNNGVVVFKKKKILTYVTTWMDREDIMLKERSQSQKENATWFHLYEISEIVKHRIRE